MKHLQKGFTLIELIVVIVILGILAAVALPKFVDFKSDAATAAAQGVAGALASASAINYAAASAGKSASLTPQTLVGVGCGTAGSGSQVFNMLVSGNPDTSKYTILSGASTCTSGSPFSCTVQYSDGTTTKSASANLTCY